MGIRPALVCVLNTHVSNVLANLGVMDSARTVAIAYECGLVGAGSVPARALP
jgi:hypothetical protein